MCGQVPLTGRVRFARGVDGYSRDSVSPNSGHDAGGDGVLQENGG